MIAGGNLPLRVLIRGGEHAHTCVSTRVHAVVHQQPLGTGMLFWGTGVLGSLGRGAGTEVLPSLLTSGLH